jgi:putative Mg2+ transporter-C (MgtC) family protein
MNDFAQTIGFVATDTPQHIILFRLLMAALFGALIGIEREQATRIAGLRTHILVSTAAALFTTLAFEIFNRGDVSGSNADPIRAVEAVTAGVAFLGAGAIFQQRGSVRGLTTGAGMWLAGAVGICAALGFYLIGLAVALFAVLVLALLKGFAHKAAGPGPEAPRQSE